MPMKWLAAWIIAVSIHELSHCLALNIWNLKIDSIYVDACGAKILTSPLTNAQTVICALAGPAGGLLLLSFIKFYPQLALCAIIQSFYNLLPIYPLDGGRILYGITHIFFSQKAADCICKTVAATVIMLLLILIAAVAILINSFVPLLIPVILFLQLWRK